ncbi:MAG: hypothetical protein ACREN5_10515 [Gemmatimonadales bacterium]
MTSLLLACGPERRGDTRAQQRYGRWYQAARLTAGADSILTITRISADSGSRDVLLVRYEFDAAEGLGDEVAITIGIDLGSVRQLKLGRSLPLGGAPGALAGAFAVTCLCEPLRPDSVVGTITVVTRGIRQITGRIDATLHSSEWNAPHRRASQVLHQRLDAIRWE